MAVSFSPSLGRERLSLDRGWRFHLGDIPFPVIRGHSDSYSNAKAGRAFGAAAPEHDDTGWRVLDLPHDWAVEGPFDPEENLSQGYRPRGVSWYRRHFPLSPADRGRHLEIQFDGVATHCTVWINGTIAHRNWCGYTSFNVDITPFAKFGEELNSIAVRVDANAMEGWWYEGAGIYRHTWLVKRDRVHVATDGVFVNPVRSADGKWTVPAEATIENCGNETANAVIEFRISDPTGNLVARGCANAVVVPLGETVAKRELSVAYPHLWSVDAPALYTVETLVVLNGVRVDAVTTTCGFRTFRFDANEGFSLNDQPLKLKGVCCHQDHAGIGIALPDALWEFRVRKLKEMGVNAYRCAHNPPSSELLDLCDREGILVMDENRHFNSTPEYMRQLAWLVRRDRNHPSVFLWSVFNEEPMQGTSVGFEMVRRMTALVKQLDATRPVTAAMNGGLFAPINVSQAVDVVGLNYQSEFYDRFHQANPNVPLTSSEDTSCFMTRGEYDTDRSRNVISSFDTERAPWGATHRDGWKQIAKRKYLAGGFVWTGFDYRGEPTPHRWPSAGSFFGCMDLCGFPKTAYYIHRAHWIENLPVLHLVPHWTWPNREGQIIRVMACSNAESVTLFLNGASLGEKSVDRYDMVSWDVPYCPGRLEAVATNQGRKVARAVVETTGVPVALRLVPDRPSLRGDGTDAQPLTVEVVDAQGRAVPTANVSVEFLLEGPGVILGHGNGDPNSHEPEKGPRRSLFNGLAQVIVQTTAGGRGKIVLRATAKDLEPAKIEIEIEESPTRPLVPNGQPVLFLEQWRISPDATLPPDPNEEVADHDMNTWAGILPGDLQSFANLTYAVYRVQFQPFLSVQRNGGAIIFKSITGAAEIWLDKDCVRKKESLASASLIVRLPARMGNRTLSVLIQSNPGRPAGLSGPVIVVDADAEKVRELILADYGPATSDSASRSEKV